MISPRITILAMICALTALPLHADDPAPPVPRTNYMAMVNKELGPEIPPDQNFFAGFLQLIPEGDREVNSTFRKQMAAALHVSATPTGGPVFDFALPKDAGERTSNEFLDRFGHFQEVAWSESDDPLLAAWVKKNSPALDAMQKVAARPGSWRPLFGDQDFLIECLLSDVQQIRAVARLYRLRIGLKLKAGDVQGAEQDLIAIYRISRHVAQGSTIIELLVGIAINAIGNQSAGEWMTYPGVTTAHRDAFLKEYRDLKPMRKVSALIHHGERYMGLEMVDVVANGGPAREKALSVTGIYSTDGPPTVLGSFAKTVINGLMTFDSTVALETMNAQYDELVRMAEMPRSPEREQQLKAFDQKLKDQQQGLSPLDLLSEESRGRALATSLGALLIPAVSQALTAEDRCSAQRELLVTALAAADFRDATGDWPSSATDLPGEAGSLTDLFTGQPYRLRRVGDDLEVYTLGPDGKDHNDPVADGGRPSYDDATITLRAKPQPALPVPVPKD